MNPSTRTTQERMKALQAGCLIVSALGFAPLSPSSLAATISNPIDPYGQDPWVIQWQGEYLYCWSEGGIRVSRSARLQDIATVPDTTIWTPPSGQPYSHNIWAPELHFLQGRWYVYFAADDGDNANHRMYVLESATDDPLGPYVLRGSITDPTNRWAIDGTVLQYDGRIYFIWSGWVGTANIQQNLFIAPMSNPWTIRGNRVLISAPGYDWERRGGPPYVNEGPEVLQREGRTFVVYSASGSWTDDYCLGRLELTGTDPLDAFDWDKHATPVFAQTSVVFGPGHASFVRSTDQTEDWIVYHTARSEGSGWDRQVQAQPFTWDPFGAPEFGTPVAPELHFPEPAGSPFGLTYEAEDARITHAQTLASPAASGEAKVGFIDFSDSAVEFTVEAARPGTYRLHIRYAAGLGPATHEVSVNGAGLQEISYPYAAWNDWQFHTSTQVSLGAGTNTIRLAKAAGYAELDFLAVHPGPDWDTDADGLYDAWERTYYGHLYEPCGEVSQDCDGDGFSTVQEHGADTDPTDSASFLHVTEIQENGGAPVIHWQGGMLSTQYLDQCSGLTAVTPDWTVVHTNLPPTTSSAYRVQRASDGSPRIFRLRAQRGPPP